MDVVTGWVFLEGVDSMGVEYLDVGSMGIVDIYVWGVDDDVVGCWVCP